MAKGAAVDEEWSHRSFVRNPFDAKCMTIVLSPFHVMVADDVKEKPVSRAEVEAASSNLHVRVELIKCMRDNLVKLTKAAAKQFSSHSKDETQNQQKKKRESTRTDTEASPPLCDSFFCHNTFAQYLNGAKDCDRIKASQIWDGVNEVLKYEQAGVSDLECCFDIEKEIVLTLHDIIGRLWPHDLVVFNENILLPEVEEKCREVVLPFIQKRMNATVGRDSQKRSTQTLTSEGYPLRKSSNEIIAIHDSLDAEQAKGDVGLEDYNPELPSKEDSMPGNSTDKVIYHDSLEDEQSEHDIGTGDSMPCNFHKVIVFHDSLEDEQSDHDIETEDDLELYHVDASSRYLLSLNIEEIHRFYRHHPKQQDKKDIKGVIPKFLKVPVQILHGKNMHEVMTMPVVASDVFTSALTKAQFDLVAHYTMLQDNLQQVLKGVCFPQTEERVQFENVIYGDDNNANECIMQPVSYVEDTAMMEQDYVSIFHQMDTLQVCDSSKACKVKQKMKPLPSVESCSDELELEDSLANSGFSAIEIEVSNNDILCKGLLNVEYSCLNAAESVNGIENVEDLHLNLRGEVLKTDFMNVENNTMGISGDKIVSDFQVTDREVQRKLGSTQKDRDDDPAEVESTLTDCDGNIVDMDMEFFGPSWEAENTCRHNLSITKMQKTLFELIEDVVAVELKHQEKLISHSHIGVLSSLMASKLELLVQEFTFMDNQQSVHVDLTRVVEACSRDLSETIKGVVTSKIWYMALLNLAHNNNIDSFKFFKDKSLSLLLDITSVGHLEDISIIISRVG